MGRITYEVVLLPKYAYGYVSKNVTELFRTLNTSRNMRLNKRTQCHRRIIKHTRGGACEEPKIIEEEVTVLHLKGIHTGCFSPCLHAGKGY